MPMIRIELYPGRTPEQKANCAREVIDVVVRTLGTKVEACQVVFHDVPQHDWHVGGKIAPAEPRRE